MRVAIIGAGVAGLSAAYRLRDAHDVHVFEASDRPGGHALTVDVLEGDRTVPLDVGFMVYNEATYPNFVALLDELRVETQASDMSFGISCSGCDLEYGTRGLGSLLAQRSNLLRPSRLALPLDLRKFYAQARSLLSADAEDGMSLDEFLERGGHRDEFKRHLLVPLISAVWSTPATEVGRFPARYLFGFMANHGLLSFGGRKLWRTVAGGSSRYVQAIEAALPNGIRTSTPVASVSRRAEGVVLGFPGGGTERFDAVVLACHSDQALALLEDASPEERTALSGLAYSESRVVLHTDSTVMPSRRTAWCSWNYKTASCSTEPGPPGITYHLNRLQSLEASKDYFVTLNPRAEIDDEHVIAELSLSHPLYADRTLDGQRLLRASNGARNTAFAGAYLGHGFHEDGVRAGLDAARAVEAMTAPASPDLEAVG